MSKFSMAALLYTLLVVILIFVIFGRMDIRFSALFAVCDHRLDSVLVTIWWEVVPLFHVCFFFFCIAAAQEALQR